MGQVRAGGAGPAVLGVDWPVLPSLPSPRAGAGRRRHGLAALPSRSPGTPPAGTGLTNERCAVPRHAVSKGGRSAAGAAAGAPCNRNKLYTGFAHECAVRRKC